jgi:hypothetical protein
MGDRYGRVYSRGRRPDRHVDCRSGTWIRRGPDRDGDTQTRRVRPAGYPTSEVLEEVARLGKALDRAGGVEGLEAGIGRAEDAWRLHHPQQQQLGTEHLAQLAGRSQGLFREWRAVEGHQNAQPLVR